MNNELDGNMQFQENGNPDQVGYPEENSEWWKEVDQDKKYIEQEMKNDKAPF